MLLIRDQIAVVYLASSAVASAIFIFASYWIYRYIDVEYASGDIFEPVKEAPVMRI